MELKRHHILAIALALILILIVLATPTEGQDGDVINTGVTDVVCIENWTYTEWSECIDGIRYRTPIGDLSQCGTMDNVSDLTVTCDSTDPQDCVEEWVCAEWSECLQGYKVRECIDNSGCSSILNKPEEMVPCEETGDVCIEDWVCSDWSECRESLQTRNCTDVKQCGTEENRPMLRRTCTVYCVEAWLCEPWSECMNGVQTRVCSDINTCQDTVVNATETQQCRVQKPDEPPPTTPEEPATERVFEDIRPEEPAKLIVDEPEVPVKQLNIRVRNRVRNARVEVKKLESRPTEIANAVRNSVGDVYNYLEIDKENITDDDVSGATVDFEVSRSWIRERRINTSTIRLMRYVNGTWTSLSTTLVSEDAGNLYFQADTPGFSIFAIAGEYMIETAGIICIPMDLRCYGNEVQECDLDGLAWTIIEECEFGCTTGGLCNEEPSEETQAQDYTIYLLIAILLVIAVLAVAMTVLKMKRNKVVKEMGSFTPPPSR